MTPEEQDVIQPQIVEPIRKKYPFITLDSIMYINPNQWTVWINRKRYVPSSTEVLEGIKLASVSKNSATIHWKPLQTNTQTPKVEIEKPFGEGVKMEFAGYDEEKEEKAEKKTLPANVKEMQNGSYAITLSTNQAFIPEDFSIYEGRAASKRINSIYQAHLAQKRIVCLLYTSPSPRDRG